MITAPDVVYGLDLSLTATGVARIAADGTATVRTVRSAGHRGDSLVSRAARISNLAYDITHGLGHPTDYPVSVTTERAVAVLEAPSYGSSGAGTWDRAGLWWAVVRRLVRRDVPVALVAPTTRAKWATGSGRAGKRDVLAAVRETFPAVKVGNDNEADALTLAHMAAFRLPRCADTWSILTCRLWHTWAAGESVAWPEELVELWAEPITSAVAA